MNSNNNTREVEEATVAFVGQWYSEADDNRVTDTYYNGKTYKVQENYWSSEGEWAVTVSMNDIRGITDTHELFETVQGWLEVMGILTGLDYELEEVIDDTVSVWSKEP